MKRHLLYIFLIIFSPFVIAQNRQIDSLLSLITTDKEDTNKVIHLNSMCREFINVGEYDKGLMYCKQALVLVQNIPPFEGSEENVALGKNVANSYNNIGLIYMYQGNYPEALKNYFSSLRIQEKIKDKRGIASSYNNIGNVYANQDNYPEALKMYAASLKIYEELKVKRGIATSYNNIGNIYHNQASIQTNSSQKEALYSESLKNYFASLKIKEEIGNKEGIAGSFINLGGLYTELNKTKEALDYLNKALALNQEIDSKDGISTCLINLGALYTKLNKTKEAQGYLNKALDLSVEIGSMDNIKETYADLAVLDSLNGNYKAAFEHHKLYIIYRDSLNNEETEKKSLRTAMQYEFDKKEIAAKAEQQKLDAISKEDKQRQKITTYSVAAVLIVVLVFSFFLYRRFKITQKQKVVIEQKEKETEAQKQIIEEKHKEITDSINYAERIQRSFMATKELLDKNLDNYFVLFKPKDIVSGDFYWASKLNNGNFALVTADSTGHGVPGAIMSLLNVTSLEKAIENHIQPSDILNATRKIIIERLKKDGTLEGGKDGMDASLTSYDFKNKKLIIAAANNPVWIVRGKETIEIKPDKMPIGKHDKQNISFTQQEIELQSGDVVYTLTDGFPDQFGGKKGKKFMSKNLLELLAANAHLPMHEQKKLLEQTFTTWVGNLEQVDDITLIGVRV